MVLVLSKGFGASMSRDLGLPASFPLLLLTVNSKEITDGEKGPEKCLLMQPFFSPNEFFE